MPTRRLPWWAAAVLLAAVGLLARIALFPVLGNRGPYIFFLLATLCSAAIGGFRSGIITAISGALLSRIFHLMDPADPTAILRFFVSALVVSYVCELLISARDRARNAEERLRESELIYRAVGESIPFAIWICEADGRNRYVCESLLKLTGMTQQECAGSGWSRALHPDD
jgi:PAS domain-containing protein